MTLAEHLAGGYDLYVRGSSQTWTKSLFAQELTVDAALLTEAKQKLAALESMMRARGGDESCHVSKMQARILRDGIAAAVTLDIQPTGAADSPLPSIA